MNKDLLIRVRDHILAEPRRLNMSNWIQSAKAGSTVFVSYETGESLEEAVLSEADAPPCGTVACIAGWAVTLDGGSRDYFSIESEAIKILGLSRIQSQELFYPDDWKDSGDYFKYKIAQTPNERADIVARVINDFIARHE